MNTEHNADTCQHPDCVKGREPSITWLCRKSRAGESHSLCYGYFGRGRSGRNYKAPCECPCHSTFSAEAVTAHMTHTME